MTDAPLRPPLVWPPEVPPAPPAMPGTGLEPRTWANTSEWWRLNHAWYDRPPVDLHGSVEPGVVEAGSGHTFAVTLRVGPDLSIPTGAHVTLEVPSTWESYMGNPYVRGLKTVGNRSQMNQGYEFVCVIEFEDESALRRYLDHPAHAELGRLFFVTAESALVYDYKMVEPARVRELVDLE